MRCDLNPRSGDTQREVRLRPDFFFAPGEGNWASPAHRTLSGQSPVSRRSEIVSDGYVYLLADSPSTLGHGYRNARMN